MRRVFWSLGMIMLLVLFAFFGEAPWHNWEAYKVGSWLSAIEMPHNTRLLAHKISVANFAGTGNSCFFAALEIRATTLTKKELLTFYEMRIEESSDLRAKWTFEILFPDEEDSYKYLDTIFRELAKRYSQASSTETIYLALAVDGPHEAGLDIRCH